MKATLKLLMVALLAGWFNVSFAQNKPDYMNPPKQGEQVIDNYWCPIKLYWCFEKTGLAFGGVSPLVYLCSL